MQTIETKLSHDSIVSCYCIFFRIVVTNYITIVTLKNTSLILTIKEDS